MNVLEIMGVVFIVELGLICLISFGSLIGGLISRAVTMDEMKKLIFAEQELKKAKEKEEKNKKEVKEENK